MKRRTANAAIPTRPPPPVPGCYAVRHLHAGRVSVYRDGSRVWQYETIDPREAWALAAYLREVALVPEATVTVYPAYLAHLRAAARQDAGLIAWCAEPAAILAALEAAGATSTPIAGRAEK